MFIESSIPIDLGSPLMGELVALLKELPSLIGVCVFYKNATGLLDQLLQRVE
jgi:hypothetical protein